MSNWSSIPYNTTASQSNMYNPNINDSSPGYLHSNTLTQNFMGENNVLEDSLPVDSENLWEDQHAVMEFMHQQDSNYQLSWKGKYLMTFND